MNKTDLSIYKYNKDIVWSLPFLFQYEIIFGSIQNTLETFGFEKIKANVFGSPKTKWSGGRLAVVKDKLEPKKLKKLFNYINTNEGIPTFTFTRTDITKADLKSEYENYLLDFGIEHGARFIVASDILKDYIKNKSPESIVVSSVLKPVFNFHGRTRLQKLTIENETNFYNKLLKEYDIVVVRPEYSKNILADTPRIIDDISRIEVLINHTCINDCPNAPMHHIITQQGHVDNSGPKIYCYKFQYPLRKQYENNPAHTQQEINKLIDAGVKNFKLQGRGENIPYLLNQLSIVTQIFNFDGPGFFLLNCMMGSSIREEYNKFFTFVDPEHQWDFEKSEIDNLSGRQFDKSDI